MSENTDFTAELAAAIAEVIERRPTPAAAEVLTAGLYLVRVGQAFVDRVSDGPPKVEVIAPISSN